MNRHLFALRVALLAGAAGAAQAQDAVESVLQAAPQLVRFAGSPENFYSLVTGLTEGTPARLAERASAASAASPRSAFR